MRGRSPGFELKKGTVPLATFGKQGEIWDRKRPPLPPLAKGGISQARDSSRLALTGNDVSRRS
jgi:hypothetical protein